MKQVTFILLLISQFSMNGQNDMWFNTGNTYHYFINGLVGGHTLLTVDRDTIISEKKTKILTAYSEYINFGAISESYSNNKLMIQVEENEIHVVNSQNEKVLLYDFNMSIGDTIQYIGGNIFQVDINCMNPNNYILDSVKTEFIANKNRLVQYLTAYDSSFYNVTGQLNSFQVKFVEGIGSLNSHLIPNLNHHCYWDEQSFRFCEFSESGEIFNPNQEICDFISSSNQLSEKEEQIHIYPTITDERFELSKVVDSVEAFTLIGQKIRLKQNSQNEYELLTNYSGIVLVKININGKSTIEKIVKR